MVKSTRKLVEEIALILFALIVLFFFYFFFVSDYDCCANDSYVNFHLPKDQIEQQKINLGRKLFFDKRLSEDNTVSCVNCHKPGLAFTDGKKVSEGVEGRLGFRNSPTLLNLAEATIFMFDAEIKSLEEQAIVPIQDHNEMNIAMGDLIKKLSKDPDYKKKAKLLFDREFDALVLTESLAAFQRSLDSKNSLFDDFINSNDSTLLSQGELNGWKLFNDLKCIECHEYPNFTNYQAMNIGLYMDYGEDQGRYRVTHDSSDMGKFKTPSLRNIEITSPYMHDGSIDELQDAISIHTRNFKMHPNKDFRITKANLTPEQEKNILSFLKTLTDR